MNKMKQMTVLLGFLVMILVVILSSAGAQDSMGYLSNTVYQGQSVFLNNAEEGFVNDQPAAIVHTGLVYADSFKVRDVTLMNSMSTIVVDHSSGGSLGTPSYIFTNITSASQNLGEDVSLEDWDLTYETTYNQTDGSKMYVYKYGNLSVGVSDTDFSIIESNGRFLLLQQAGGSLSAAEIEEPFAMSEVEIISLALILVVVAIIAYWYAKFSKDWRSA
jgi:hypothetical protein